jgi:hypothetical protein
MADIHQQELAREQREAQRLNQAIADTNDFKTVASSPAGRRFLRSLLTECGIYHSTFTGDALTSAYAEGKRAIGLSVIDRFNDCPELYIQLLTEKHDDDRNSAASE